MGDGLSEIAENQVPTYATEMLCRMWGRTRDEILGRKVDAFLDNENRKILSCQLEKRRKGER
ncbi:MAG: LysR family transcriptional regulator, partial [Desulfobacula sp.]|nr:LysR family transcriptional regulator [Desulfobacula sp.]